MRHKAEIQVRFSDLDAYGHVNNANYLSYLEIARVEMMNDIFLEDMKKNVQYLLIQANIEYKRSIMLEDTVIVECVFAEAGNVRFRVDYKVHNGEGVVFATGYTMHALYNGNTNRPMRMPKQWHEFVESL